MKKIKNIFIEEFISPKPIKYDNISEIKFSLISVAECYEAVFATGFEQIPGRTMYKTSNYEKSFI